MRVGSRICTVLALAVLVLAVVACSPEGPNEETPGGEAGALFADAVVLVERGREEERSSYDSAHRFYRSAQNLVETLRRDYPDAKVTRGLIDGSVRIGSLDLDGLDDLAARAATRAQAEVDPLACLHTVIASVAEPSNRARLLARAARSEHSHRQGDQWRTTLGRAREVAAEIDNARDRTMALVAVLGVHAELGDLAGTDEILAAIDAGEPVPRVLARAELARALASRGESDPAAARFAEAVSIAASIDGTEDKAARQWAFTELAAAAAERSDPEGVERMLEQIAGPRDRAGALATVASLSAAAGDREAAAGYTARALDASSGIDEPYPLAMALAEIAAVHQDIGEDERAAALLGQALNVAMDLGHFESVKSGALAKIARKYARAGQYDMAFVITEAMIDDEAADQSWAKAGIAHYFARRGDFDSAFPVARSVDRTQVRLTTLAEMLLTYIDAQPADGPANRARLRGVLESLESLPASTD